MPNGSSVRPPAFGWWIPALVALAFFFVASTALEARSALESPANPPRLDSNQAPMLNYCFQGLVPEARLVVIDKSRQRLMVLRYAGQLVLEYEFPCATGAQPGTKQAEGDERTPTGIYFTTHRYRDNKITIFGDRAIHLNFPNPFDQTAGRQGNGIYIHGTNQILKPRSSNGCVVLRNQDLAILAPLISEQLTPIIVVEELNLADKAQRINACRVLTSLEGMGQAPLSPAMGQLLALKSPSGPQPDWLDSLAPRLGGLDTSKVRGLSMHNMGQMLLGLGDQWVLMVGQELRAARHKPLPVLRRFYFEGLPSSKMLVKDHWIVPNEAGAKHLARLAPKQAPKPPAPVKVAQAKPGPVPKPTAQSASSQTENEEKQVLAMVAGWLKAWQSKNLRRYMAYYAPAFKADGKNRTQWRRQKAYLNRVYKIIRVKAEDLKVRVDGKRARVSFVQHYRSDWHRDSGLKTLELVKDRGRWKILGENWKQLPPGRGGRASGQGRAS